MYRYILLLIFLLTGCQKTAPVTKLEGFTQGTTYHFSFVAPKDADIAAIQSDINREFARIDLALSNYRDDSAIEAFNANKTTDPIEVSNELVFLVETARRIHKASNGCYDLTIKPLFDLWGFKKHEFSPPTEEALNRTLEQVGMDKLETVSSNQLRKQLADLRIDVSSIGQGYTVHRIAELLEERGIEQYLVEIGGELKVRGHKPDGTPWRIALEKPLPNERSLHKIVAFDDGKPMSLMASGTYRHFFDSEGKRYAHILDARSGKPVEHATVSVAILHEDPTVADAWSTALLCLGSKEGLEVANRESLAALFIDQIDDKLIETSSQAMQKIQGVSVTDK